MNMERHEIETINKLLKSECAPDAKKRLIVIKGNALVASTSDDISSPDVQPRSEVIWELEKQLEDQFEQIWDLEERIGQMDQTLNVLLDLVGALYGYEEGLPREVLEKYHQCKGRLCDSATCRHN